MEPLLSDERVRLNFENLENRRVKPVTILLTEEEKEQLRTQRAAQRLNKLIPVLMMSRIRRSFYVKGSK